MKRRVFPATAPARQSRDVCIFCFHQLRPSSELCKALLTQTEPHSVRSQRRTITNSSKSQNESLSSVQLNRLSREQRIREVLRTPGKPPNEQMKKRLNDSPWNKLPQRRQSESYGAGAKLHPSQWKASPRPPKIPYNGPSRIFKEGSTDFIGFKKDQGGPSEMRTKKPSVQNPNRTHRGKNGEPTQASKQVVTAVPEEGLFGVPELDNIHTDRAVKGRWSRVTNGSELAASRRGGKIKERGGLTRREQKFEVEDALESEAERSAREAKQQKRKEKKMAAASALVPIELPQFITVANLSTLLKVRQEAFIKKLEELGFGSDEVAPNHVLGFENASLIAMEFNYEPMTDRSELEDLKAQPQPEDRSILPPRAPVVTIMGHVDHGKTTLLDYLRKSSVAASEHGGITQHIGAFSVPMPSGTTVTFLDTPGHAAFLSMRQRGAHVTDIVVLVVAADDSVKPQTIEAIKHAKAANVPIIVAINKIDKEGADIELVKKDLTRHDIVVEDYGGDIQAIPVSGKTGQGLQDLEEALVAQAETIELRTAIDGVAEGWVIEAGTKSNGRVATVLVKRGTMRPGDIIVAGNTWARIRTLRNEAGVQVLEAGPGTPVEVDGWKEQPTAGDEVLQAATEQKAASVVDYRLAKVERVKAAADIDAINAARRVEAERREWEKIEAAMSNDQDRSSRSTATGTAQVEKKQGETVLYFIIKTDVSGSAEAVEGCVVSLPLANQPVKVSVLRAGVGPVTESDVSHVGAVPAGQGFILSFNQSTSPAISQLAERSGVRILEENIIYNVIDTVRGLVEQCLPPIVTQKVLGEAEAAANFDINVGGRKTMRIAGCKVRNGMIYKGKKVRVSRRGETVYAGTVSSLKFHKKDVTEIGKGSECGIAFEGWELFEVGDAIQCFEEKREPRRLT